MIKAPVIDRCFFLFFTRVGSDVARLIVTESPPGWLWRTVDEALKDELLMSLSEGCFNILLAYSMLKGRVGLTEKRIFNYAKQYITSPHLINEKHENDNKKIWKLHFQPEKFNWKWPLFNWKWPLFNWKWPFYTIFM